MALRGASARRYAEAIFDLARERDALDAWARDLDAVAAFVSEADVARVLGAARVPREEKLRLLAAGLERDVSPLAMNLVRLLAQRDRLQLAPSIREEFAAMADEYRGIAHATVTTAVPLSEDEQRAVRERLSQITGKRIEVTSQVDESIIGGVVARIGDQLIDGSTRTKLVALKRRLSEAR
jgi:F-type H+-transporting ATPase subunit delta